MILLVTPNFLSYLELLINNEIYFCWSRSQLYQNHCIQSVDKGSHFDVSPWVDD